MLKSLLLGPQNGTPDFGIYIYICLAKALNPSAPGFMA